jgi:hypothetical protein
MQSFLLTIVFCIGLYAQSFCQEIKEGKRMVFSADRQLAGFCSDSVRLSFTPALSEIDSVDMYLKKFLRLKSPNQLQPHNLEDYYRQYIGRIIDKQKVVIVMGYCSKMKHYYKHFYDAVISVRGGGDCFFEAEVNLQNKQIQHFHFNAPR